MCLQRVLTELWDGRRDRADRVFFHVILVVPSDIVHSHTGNATALTTHIDMCLPSLVSTPNNERHLSRADLTNALQTAQYR